ncbi:hypothetical protein BDR04DRAFT_1107871 [Suillus decipiens]|nr:hypothetical protein BDR04DRAFT_1107871 [Suillus decipiens]
MVQTLFEVILQNYYRRLADHGLISQSKAIQKLEELVSIDADFAFCPICSHRLLICHGCSNATCDNSCCKGAKLISSVSSCQSCFLTLVIISPCNQYDCPSRAHSTGGAICPDCVKTTDGHLICLCGNNWICGACAIATQKEDSDYGTRCPRCQNYFCFLGCRYIETCRDCRKMRLCDDCMEEEFSDGEGSSSANKGAFLVATCEGCQDRVCIDCLEGRERCCEFCSTVYCRHCMDYEGCEGCGALMCMKCFEHGCRRCHF